MELFIDDLNKMAASTRMQECHIAPSGWKDALASMELKIALNDFC
jgi:hypothetical protein